MTDEEAAALERDCTLEFFVAGGPGGQHRNKTSSGVRLRHGPTGLVIEATERRSQHQNRAIALERLQAKLIARARKPKPRKKTKVPRSAKRVRLETKKRTGQKKAARRPGKDD